jgi:hypothetical protein
MLTDIGSEALSHGGAWAVAFIITLMVLLNR